MQARKQQFKVGDKAVYPAKGVAEVVSIEEKDIAGNRLQFYVLRLLDTEHKIMVPVANAKKTTAAKTTARTLWPRIQCPSPGTSHAAAKSIGGALVLVLASPSASEALAPLLSPTIILAPSRFFRFPRVCGERCARDLLESPVYYLPHP